MAAPKAAAVAKNIRKKKVRWPKWQSSNSGHTHTHTHTPQQSHTNKALHPQKQHSNGHRDMPKGLAKWLPTTNRKLRTTVAS